MTACSRTCDLVVLCLALACGPAPDDGASASASGGTTQEVTTGAGPTSSTSGTATASGSATSSTSTDSTGSTDSTSSGTAGSSSSTGTSAGETGSGAPFVHEFHTALVDGRLAFLSNLPPEVAACEALPNVDPPCADVDADGLVDAWEDALFARMRPLRRFDEEESLIDDPKAVIADVGRVARNGDHTRVFVMLGYHRDYGSCGGISGHNGDSERVALDLVAYPEGGPGGVRVDRAYTAAHEGTANDHGHVYAGDELTQLVHGVDPEAQEPRWAVYPSADKHATYATVAICEGISLIPCIDEDCGADGVDDPMAYERLPDMAQNAGEEAAPRLTDLASVGFPGDDAWADQDFCGGLGPGTCSASVRSKLLADPFN